MTVDVELDGARRGVSLRREGSGWVVGLDGREVPVSVVETGGSVHRSRNGGGRWSMLVGREPGLSRVSYDVVFEPRPGGLVVHVGGVAVPVTIVRPGSSKPRATAAERPTHGRTHGGGAQPAAITAPMPGRIVKVLVKPGEAVEARQGLIVLEAMKMEHELRAPGDGTVAEVRVVEGAAVEADAVLVVLR